MNLLIALVVGVLLIGGRAFAEEAAPKALVFRSATPNLTTVPRYGRFGLRLDLEAAYDNPFDPDQIDVYARFTSPAGKQIRVNGFLDQPFTRTLEGRTEQIKPAGEPVWKICFAPDSVGHWRYQVFARTPTGSAQLPERSFEVSPSDSPGFIRCSRTNPGAFAYDNGQPFFAVGENVCWGGSRGSFDYDDWLPALGQAGGNWIRLWMCSWNCALEWSGDPKGDRRSGRYHGVGVYSLDNAWKLDTILDIAERSGIKVMLCLGTYGEFNEGGYFNEGQWKANPYNKVNGGPCDKPSEFWINPTARKLYQRRLRYLAARYGWRTGLQAWEFWNEAKAPAPWVAEMARFLKGTGEFKGHPADPYGHLISTTYGTPEVWRIPEIDFTQTHNYGTANIADHAPVAHRDALQSAAYHKPHLLAEFGIDWRASDRKYDRAGQAVNLHNALWAAAVSGDAGGAMIWYWDNYVHPDNLYGQFTPLRKFTDTVPWTDGPWKPLTADAPKVHLYGLVCGRHTILWAQNPAHNWKNVFDEKPIAAIPSHEVTLHGLPAGNYSVEWWDTSAGAPTKRESVEVTADGLRLRLPELKTDVAARIEAKMDKEDSRK